MPLYEYKCDACGHAFEKIVKFSDPPLDACPKCGGAVQKLFSSPAIQFKGSGWYITDYAKKSSGDSSAKAKADTSEKSDTKSSDASTPSTPAPTATSSKD
jgi:putative FmdB family regulatory protein